VIIYDFAGFIPVPSGIEIIVTISGRTRKKKRGEIFGSNKL
jgi:hypothetical protein